MAPAKRKAESFLVCGFLVSGFIASVLQLIQVMKYTLTDFHSRYGRQQSSIDHERSFFVYHIVPAFTYFVN